MSRSGTCRLAKSRGGTVATTRRGGGARQSPERSRFAVLLRSLLSLQTLESQRFQLSALIQRPPGARQRGRAHPSNRRLIVPLPRVFDSSHQLQLANPQFRKTIPEFREATRAIKSSSQKPPYPVPPVKKSFDSVRSTSILVTFQLEDWSDGVKRPSDRSVV
jgi:hypothetical protein